MREFLILSTSSADGPALISDLKEATKQAPDYRQVATVGDLAAALAERKWDAILCDFAPSQFDPTSALQAARTLQPQTPFIFLADRATVRDAVAMMRLGAAALVEKTDRQHLIDIINQEQSPPHPADDAEADLNEHNQHLSVILNRTQDAILSASLPEYHIIFVSEHFEDVFGYPAEQILSDPQFFTRIVPPDDLEQAEKAMQTALQAGFAELDHRIIHPDGQVRWLHRRAWVDHDSEGRPIRVNDSARDITARKELEEALRVSEELYRLTLSNISDAVFITDSNGDFTFICPNANILFGYTAAEIAAMGNIAALLGDALFDPNVLAQRGEIPNIELEIEDKFHQRHTVLVTVKQTSIGKGTTLYTCRDITERKQVERALYLSVTRLRSLLDNMQDLVWSAELPDFQLTYLNPAIHTIYGRPEQAFYDDDQLWQKVVHPEDIPRVAELHDELMQQGSRDGEYRIIRPDGEVRWLHDRAWLVRDKQGHATSAEGIASDITERKQAEAALHRANLELETRVVQRTADLERAKDRVEAIFNHSADGILLLDREGRIQQANYAFNEMLGDTDAQHFDVRLAACVHPDNAPALASAIQDAAESHHTRTIEAQVMQAGGTAVEAEISISPINRSNRMVENLVCIVRNISERKEAEAKLQNHAEEIHDLYNNAPTGYHSLDTEGRFVAINDTELRWLGYTREELIGKRRAIELMTPDSQNTFREYFPIYKKQGYIRDLEFEFVRKDGSTFFGLLSATAIYDENGQITHSRSTLFDITELKKAQQAIHESEVLYRSLVNTMSEGIVLQVQDGTIQFCNARAEHILGLSADQLMGRTSVDPRWQAIHEDGSPFPGETHPAMITLRTGEPCSNVMMGIHKPDGELAWILINSQPLLDPYATGPQAVVVTFADVTDLKRAETQLQEQRQQELEMQAHLKALHEITIELTRAETLDDFYRLTVELGLERFGFERMGLLLYDTDNECAIGTYGTDALGSVVAEHDYRFATTELTGILKRTLDRTQRFVFEEDAQLYANFKAIGTGQNAVAALWNGKALGWLAVDNGVAHKPISKAQLDILALYALSAGALLGRKHTELALRDSEERFRRFVEAAPLATIIADQEGQIVIANRQAELLFGYTSAELLGQTIELLVPIDKRKAHAHSRHTYATTESQRIGALELAGRRKDGSVFPAEITLSHIETAAGIMVMCYIVDITERKEAEASLRASELRYRSLFEQSNDAVFILGLDDRILQANQRAADMLGYRLDELIGTSPFAHIAPSEQPASHATRSSLLAAEVLPIFERNFHRKDGETFPAEINIELVRDEQGTPLHVQSIVRDITQRKKSEDALREALAQEKELGILKSRFVSMASHEFRTPLAAILAATETLKIYRDRMDKAQIEARLDRIHQQVNHLKDIIENVLDLSRIQAGRVEFRPETGNICALCKEIVEEFASSAAYRGRVLFDCPTSPVIAHFDRRLMRQVIGNIVHNALKYSPSDTSVQVHLAQDETQITLKVKDQGIGIPPKDLKHLFEPFHRAGNVGDISGTGLGLSIAKQSVEAHRGTISVTSEVDRGTEFTIVLSKHRDQGD